MLRRNANKLTRGKGRPVNLDERGVVVDLVNAAAPQTAVSMGEESCGAVSADCRLHYNKPDIPT
jgi:hypothetical protein